MIPESVNHLPAPVNSVFNDYLVLPVDSKNVYIVSDRDSLTGDDIYYVRMPHDLGLQNNTPDCAIVENDTVLDGDLLLDELDESSDLGVVSLKHLAPEGLLLSLYFDSDRLIQKSLLALEKFIEEMNNYQFTSLVFDGYSDKTENPNYNLYLSERRANEVVRYLKSLGLNCKFNIRPHGVIKFDKQGEFHQLEKDIEKINPNWMSRRVDIYHQRELTE